LMDDAMARALKDSGCAGVNWSIESGSDEIRNNVLKRHMSREAIMTAAKALTKQRIPYRIGNMVGVPSETWDDMCRTVELNIAVKPALATAAIFTPFPGLAITHYVIDHGYCDAAVTAHMPANMFTRSVMKMGVEENRMVQRMAYLFPFFVGFPRLYRGKGVRAFLLRMPVSVLRAAYHLFYAFKMMRMYRVRSSWMLRLRLAGRYIRMLFS
jgi:anaerobic magnesium-protoporphyrin IX monomethyl ester cyclase